MQGLYAVPFTVLSLDGAVVSHLIGSVCDVSSHFWQWLKKSQDQDLFAGEIRKSLDRSKSEVFLIVLVVRAHPFLFTSGLVNCIWQWSSMWWRKLSSC